MRNIGSRLELFVDHFLLEHLDRARLVLHPPVPREVALQFDAPWEGPASAYVTVLEDEGRFRAYYRGWTIGAFPEVTCCAESADGIHWTKPSLGICAFQGSKENNIVYDGSSAHTFMVCKDANPAARAAERYKALAGGAPFAPKHMFAMASPDGLHWRHMQEGPVITQECCDWGADLAFWDAAHQQYVAHLRAWRTPSSLVQVPLHHLKDFRRMGIAEGYTDQGETVYRQVARYTSPDFIHWTEEGLFDYGQAPVEHFYTNAASPYFRAPHLSLGFPKRLVFGRQVVPEHPQPGLSDGVFITSRDGLHWDRTFVDAFLRPGRDIRNWVERNMQMAWGILQTAPDELSLYWVEHHRHATCRLRRGTVRLDGFASLHAGYAGGEAVTHPLIFSGRELVLNYATSAAGSVRVELQDSEGHPIPGYTLAESPALYGDEIARPFAWQGGSNVSPLAGRPVRIRFVLMDADLFTMTFRP